MIRLEATRHALGGISLILTGTKPASRGCAHRLAAEPKWAIQRLLSHQERTIVDLESRPFGDRRQTFSTVAAVLLGIGSSHTPSHSWLQRSVRIYIYSCCCAVSRLYRCGMHSTSHTDSSTLRGLETTPLDIRKLRPVISGTHQRWSRCTTHYTRLGHTARLAAGCISPDGDWYQYFRIAMQLRSTCEACGIESSLVTMSRVREPE